MLLKHVKFSSFFILYTSISLTFVGVAYGDNLTSTNYIFTEGAINSGGLNNSSSSNYRARDGVGDASVGNGTSANFQVNAGSVTTNDPTLSFAISVPSVDLGLFSTSSSTITTATFSVLNYTSYGYVVQVIGNPPTSGTHTLTPLATATASSVGTEQFGINLVANTSPTSYGANPVNGQFGFGSAAPNYATPNKYRYGSGETIALAPSSGISNYTISYLINVDNFTPKGVYTANETVIVTGTY